MYFSRVLDTDHGTNIVRNICPTGQPFLSKTSAGSKWNCSFLKLCIYLISNFACKDKNYGIFLDWIYLDWDHRKCSKYVLKILKKNLQENTYTDMVTVIMSIYPQRLDMKTTYKNRTFDVLYVIWM